MWAYWGWFGGGVGDSGRRFGELLNLLGRSAVSHFDLDIGKRFDLRYSSIWRKAKVFGRFY